MVLKKRPIVNYFICICSFRNRWNLTLLLSQTTRQRRLLIGDFDPRKHGILERTYDLKVSVKILVAIKSYGL